MYKLPQPTRNTDFGEKTFQDFSPSNAGYNCQDHTLDDSKSNCR